MSGAGRVAVLVEGESDRAAVLALAARRAAPLDGVEVVAMGGITNVARYVAELGPAGRGLSLAGLYDAGEERYVRDALERGGLRPGTDLAGLGFHGCEKDLEDELIRALGVARVLAVVEAEGDLGPFRGLQQQPAQRDRPTGDQLHRFLGSGSGRKLRYARLLVEALRDDEVPAPLARVLADALG
ncbi:MAG TPA: TOPRIM nucleotidyl transferase/hydrolase domain-containing protein [Nocardioides sp.]|uniref:TOPRIM nucleotidyl transferase/hydrolase domain-containing protein n=1 Tax=Nocardioides sp. TaxID=35761 RepID=UPI002E36F0DD|nr:TOPRIM nucleotidyl transferase/hydrolase domain-containing protein [Nocardioides sp.]HEX5087877.1 TOPRIM nucleotidyl transferase/hydrolase domain-containing protein [Nocardioides sp.]